MNVSIETMTGLERRLTIALPSEDFESQITERLEDARGKVSLPGFRPGKVPLREVRRRFGNSVRAEVAGELMQASFFDAVQQEDLNPAGSPNLEVVKMDPGIDFEFTATFEVFPAIDIADLAKVSVKKPTATITDDDLEAMIQRLREQRTTFVEVARAAATGDQVKADFAATLNGEPVEGTEGQDVEFRLGQGQMIDDFDQGVSGMSVGETKSFPATFPEDYRAENLQGETVEFTVTVKAVTEPQLPELNDEFFEGFGVSEGGEAAFREEVKSNMQRELDAAINNQLKQQVMDSLADLHEFQLPHAIVHREIHVLKEQMLGQFQMGGQGQQMPDLPDELFTEQAQRRVKVGLVVNEIIRKADIEADPEQVEAKLQEIAAPYGEPEQVIAYYRSNAEQMQSIEMGVLEDQVVDHIIKAAQVQVVEASYDDVLSGQAIADPDASEDDAADGDDAAKTDATKTTATGE